jgi:hypothetical protein
MVGVKDSSDLETYPDFDVATESNDGISPS